MERAPRDLQRYAPETSGICSGTWPAATSYRQPAMLWRGGTLPQEARPALSNAAHEVLASALPRPADARRNLPRARGEFRRRGAEPPGARPPRRGRHGPRRPGARPPSSASRTSSWRPRLLLGRLPAPGLPGQPRRLSRVHERLTSATTPPEDAGETPCAPAAFSPGPAQHPAPQGGSPRFLRAAWRCDRRDGSLGATVTPQDEVTLDGNPVRLPDTQIYLALNKPRAFLRPCATTAAAGPWPT